MGLIAQADRSDAGRDIEPGIAFEADRLQRNRAVGAADQHIGADPDADRGARGGTSEVSGKRARSHIVGRRKHRPNQDPASGEADVGPEPGDGAIIVILAARSG